MIKIELLKNHPEFIPRLSKIWYDVLGKIWMPKITMEEIQSLLYEELSHDMPMTYIPLCNEIPVGFATLELEMAIFDRI